MLLIWFLGCPDLHPHNALSLLTPWASSYDVSCATPCPSQEWIRDVALPAWEPEAFDDKRKLRDAEKKVPGTIRAVFFQGLAIKDSTKLIQQGKARQVLLDASTLAYKASGRRLKHVTFAMDEQGKFMLESKTSGVFKFLPAEGPKDSVEHISGVTVKLPSTLAITEKHSISKCSLEHAAQVEEGRIGQSIMKLFDPWQRAKIETGRAEGLNKFILQNYGGLTVEASVGVGCGEDAELKSQRPAAPAKAAARPKTL